MNNGKLHVTLLYHLIKLFRVFEYINLKIFPEDLMLHWSSSCQAVPLAQVAPPLSLFKTLLYVTSGVLLSFVVLSKARI